MASTVMSSPTPELKTQTHSEGDEASTNQAAPDISQAQDNQQTVLPRNSSSYYARGGPDHEFKSYLLDEK